MEELPSVAARRMAARRALGLSDEALSWECEFDVFVASGPGGQHRNKTESGVRLTHPATGIVISATERRSQLMNKAAAIERLREKLQALTVVPKPRKPTKPSRGARERRLTDKKITSGHKRLRRDKHFD